MKFKALWVMFTLLIIPTVVLAQTENEIRQAYLTQAIQDEKLLWDSMKDMSPEQRLSAVMFYRGTFAQKYKAYLGQMHQMKLELLKSKLKENKKLTVETKNEIISYLETQYQEDLKLRDQILRNSNDRYVSIKANLMKNAEQNKSKNAVQQKKGADQKQQKTPIQKK